MPSPFPGMDPYLKVSGDWRDFQARFLNGCADALADRLPRNYIARIEERFEVLEYPQESVQHRYADVSITRSRPSVPLVSSPSPVATLEPEIMPLVTTITEEIKERWIEIRRAPDWKPVTIIELLSPTNKHGHGHDDYLYKRVSLIAREIHIVELDLLIGGRRLPMGLPLKGNYHAMVSRTEERLLSNDYSWTIRDPLSTIPVPLRAPDPDMELNIAAIFASVYQNGQYDRSINYDATLELHLSPNDLAWLRRHAASIPQP